MPVLNTCLNCGEKYPIKPSHAHKSSYCSKACMGAHYKVRMSGDGNPNYSAAGERTCARCDLRFVSYQKARRYCSAACYRGSDEFAEHLRRISPLGGEAKRRGALLRHIDFGEVRVKVRARTQTAKRKTKRAKEKHRKLSDVAPMAIKLRKRKPEKKAWVICCVCCRWFATRACAPRKTCSTECLNEWKSIRQRGEKSHHWKGGKTSKAMRIRNSREYATWRTAVYERDDYTCKQCGQKGGRLTAHHIKPFSTHPELAMDLANGQTLCLPCHRKTDTWGHRATKPSAPRNRMGRWVTSPQEAVDAVTEAAFGEGE